MKVSIQKIAAVAGFLMTVGLGTFSAWIWTYHEKFVVTVEYEKYKEEIEEYKEEEKLKDALKNLDNNKEHVITRITFFEVIGLSNLNDEQRAVYKRINARLISLQARRDEITSGSNN